MMKKYDIEEKIPEIEEWIIECSEKYEIIIKINEINDTYNIKKWRYLTDKEKEKLCEKCGSFLNPIISTSNWSLCKCGDLLGKNGVLYERIKA